MTRSAEGGGSLTIRISKRNYALCSLLGAYLNLKSDILRPVIIGDCTTVAFARHRSLGLHGDARRRPAASGTWTTWPKYDLRALLRSLYEDNKTVIPYDYIRIYRVFAASGDGSLGQLAARGMEETNTNKD
ncbi:hypothetical protein DTO169E5_1225 [Paecilomyces variotii]|nr:hypothetical protein DTO169C6_7611 [Paecilomyces variotii]KAJ9244844.1 hypothetical protein DTO169E5_1225 [Paecilomyces variotii]